MLTEMSTCMCTFNYQRLKFINVRVPNLIVTTISAASKLNVTKSTKHNNVSNPQWGWHDESLGAVMTQMLYMW